MTEQSGVGILIDRMIVTAVGKNRVGVLAEVTTRIAEMEGNIMDISQKMTQDYFNLLMIVEIAHAPDRFERFVSEMTRLGEEKGYKILVQHERVFQYMHRP
ncbi:MAG: ACT domain-containing protein [Armatimonadetes bacterium]|nr:ACT domain-containing protein [Armatimonadota bacterium]